MITFGITSYNFDILYYILQAICNKARHILAYDDKCHFFLCKKCQLHFPTMPSLKYHVESKHSSVLHAHAEPKLSENLQLQNKSDDDVTNRSDENGGQDKAEPDVDDATNDKLSQKTEKGHCPTEKNDSGDNGSDDVDCKLESFVLGLKLQRKYNPGQLKFRFMGIFYN